MEKPKLYRQRFIPLELVYLEEDEILQMNQDIIVTKWNVLRPRKDFAKGFSCYFIKEGYKLSKFLDKRGNLVYYYCDVIETRYNPDENAYTFMDLLADVIIYENGSVKVVDIGEIADAIEKNIITVDLAKKALRRLDKLLDLVYSGRVPELLKKFF